MKSNNTMILPGYGNRNKVTAIMLQEEEEGERGERAGQADKVQWPMGQMQTTATKSTRNTRQIFGQKLWQVHKLSLKLTLKRHEQGTGDKVHLNCQLRLNKRRKTTQQQQHNDTATLSAR